MSAAHLAPAAGLRGYLDRFAIGGLTPHDERRLLLQLAECKRKLASAPPGGEGAQVPPGAEALRTSTHPTSSPGSRECRNIPAPGAIRRRYLELRSRLALGSMGLVSFAAKRYRDRGIPHSDLMQEGFCGLLEAIDRFDVSNPNRLANYAMWWIRQRMQRAVAAGAYPVRLTPRCLRRLADDWGHGERTTRDPEQAPRTAMGPPPTDILRLRAITRPAVRLEGTRHGESPIIQAIVDPDGDATCEVDARETVERLMGSLPPREKHVLCLRFGLEGQAQHSLSQAGKVLGVSKERIRQIQDTALEKLRAAL
jgi:RNA polymerase sigma factor (sigma-70 family)